MTNVDGHNPSATEREIGLDASREDTAERFSRFCSTMRSTGLRRALAELAAPTNYRFIAIFRTAGDRANAAVFYDRENPGVLAVDEVPASATYCSFAHRSRSPFVTEDAAQDPRLLAHVAREHVRAYCGVPIMTPEGQVLGTLCHYDLVPRDHSQVDLALLCEIASALEQGHHVPPYPT